MTAALTRPAPVRGRVTSRVPGLIAVGAVAITATAAGRIVPVVGGPVAAVVVGASLAGWVRRKADVDPGLAVGRGPVLQVAVVLLGAQLSLGRAASVGLTSLPVMIGTLLTCLLLAALVGRALGVGRDLRTLVGVGTAICGASAIAAVSPVLRARSPDVSYALSTIFVFNVLAVVTFPLLGHALGLSQTQFGTFAGTAVNDMSSVVAAASSYGDTAAHQAVVVKLARTLMIVPVCLTLAALVRRRDGGDPARRPLHRLVPWFLVGFLALAAARSAGAIPTAALPVLGELSTLGIIAALAAIGLSTDVPALRRTGARPLLLGLLLWIAVSVVGLGLLLLTSL